MIYGDSKIVGIIGDPVSHSLSPKMHNAGYAELGLHYVYVPFHITPPHLELFLRSMVAFNYVGVNVTIPYKEAVIPHLHHIDPLAKKIGAVNTIVNQDGKLTGYNTDGDGFLTALLDTPTPFNLTNKRIVILGAGGSARAIAFTLLTHPIQHLTICNRNLSRATELVQDLSKHSPIPITAHPLDDTLPPHLASADLIINTTPLGMAPNIQQVPTSGLLRNAPDVRFIGERGLPRRREQSEAGVVELPENRADGVFRDSPISDFSWITPKHVVYDIIYKPEKTLLLAQAEARGARSINGAGMLAGQGALAFKHFTGHHIPFKFMLREVTNGCNSI